MSPIASARPSAASVSASAAPPKPRCRSNDEYRWTPEKAQAFLRLVAEGASIAAAARRLGMSRQSAYRLRARFSSTPFARAWELARELGKARKVTERAAAR